MDRGVVSCTAVFLILLVGACGGLLRDDETSGTNTNSDAGDAGAISSDSDVTSISTLPQWSCLGHVAPQSSAKASLSWQVKPVDVVNGTTFSGLAVQACGSNDGTCASPIATTSTNASSGIATLSIVAGAQGFDGFWETQPPGDLLNLYFSNVPVVNDVQVDDRQTWSGGVLDVALGSSGTKWDESKGVVGFQIHDCNSKFLHQDRDDDDDALASGVALSIDPPSADIVLGYFDSDTISVTQGETDSSGQGGFVNVPEGWVTLTATLVATGQTIGTARAYSKAGALSGVVLSPR